MNYFYLVPAASIVALIFAYYFFKKMMKESEGTEKMKTIAQYVRDGAMSYLKQQYKVVVVVFVILAFLFAGMAYFGLQNNWVPFAFITGGFFSALAGFFGMKTATYASARTTNAVQRSLNQGLKIAFRSGAVMGLVVVGLALLDISAWYLILDNFVDDADAGHKLIMITTTMLTFAMGASTQALFARVGGGIYTKAADVGADLVGKVEAGISEDDPRNPAVIADNVGDNVGDIAGMRSDLLESYVGAIISAFTLGVASIIYSPAITAIFPLLIAATGLIAVMISITVIRSKEWKNPQKTLNIATYIANITVVVASLVFSLLLLDSVKPFFAIITGLLVGVFIAFIAEYYTSDKFKPVKEVADESQTGHATNRS